MANGIRSETNGITRGTNGGTLLNCPFCGGRASRIKAWQNDEGRYYPAMCGCRKCGIWFYGDSDYGHGGFANKEDCKASMEQAASKWNTRAGGEIAATLGSGKLTAEQVREAVNGHGNIMDNRLYCDWQAIADELCDRDYERKMDALLCRLTNGKFSKSRQYDLDFMESCINEEFEQLYAGELADAMLGRGKLTAEQVRNAIFRCGVWDEDSAMYYVNRTDMQAITDELNATLGGGECEIVEHYVARTRGEIGRERVKLSCGHIVERHSKFCPECGARIREEMKR